MAQNRVLSFLLVLLVILMVVYNVQVARVTRFDGQVRELQDEQTAVIEENKRIMAARELIRDPQAIRKIAEQELGYQLLGFDSTIYLETEQ